MKYYIIAGESSGDLHGSNLMKQLREQDAEADFRCWGGDMMREAGGNIVKHYRDLAFMGFTEVIKHLGTIMRNIRFCKSDILQYNPDVLILIDYPGFNLRIAEFAKKAGIRVFYYISPQIWAWKQSRIKIIRKNVERMYVILPFEKDFYKSFGVDVDFVGHPLLDAIDNYRQHSKSEDLNYTKPIVAILPGSRKQEIMKMLPLMLPLSKFFPEMQFVIAGTSSVNKDVYGSLSEYDNVSIEYNKTYEILSVAKAALVTSGTATLETALFGVPEVVCYKGSFLSYHIAKRVIKVKYISLVNLIMDKKVVEELIQNALSIENLRKSLTELLYNEEKIKENQKQFEELRLKLGSKGASAKAALLMNARLHNTIPL